MGPSGSGKDSLMKWVMLNKNDNLCLRWSQRLVTRDNREAKFQEDMDQFINEDQFEALRSQNLLAMHWTAHDFSYGIKRSELLSQSQDEWVLINGSRAYFAKARTLFPELKAIHITASHDILQKRLLARARESEEAINSRLSRAEVYQPQESDAWLEVKNDGELEAGGQVILAYLTQLKNEPS